MTNALQPWTTPKLDDLGPVSVAEASGGFGNDSSTSSGGSIG